MKFRSSVNSTVFIFGFLLLSATYVHAQVPAQLIRRGDAAAANERWEEAFSFYEQAYEMDTASFEYTSKYARAAAEVKYYDLAGRLYEKNYEKDSGAMDPIALYWIAYAQMSHGKYEDAQRNFKKLLKKHRSAIEKDLAEKAEQMAKSSVWALNHLNESNDVLVNILLGNESSSLIFSGAERLNEQVNKSESEMGSCFIDDTLYYSSYADQFWKIYFASGGESNDVFRPIMSAQLSGVNDANASNANFNRLDNLVFFSKATSDGTQILSGLWESGMVTDVKMLDKINDKGSINTMPHAAMVKGKMYLFFVSNREGGEGGLDIWFSEFKDGWKEPKSAGKRVNSPGNEVTPFFFNDGLFFSSDWHEGYGGHDVFYVVNKSGSFEKPVNCGRSVNSYVNDVAFHLGNVDAGRSIQCFVSSNRVDEGVESNYCCNDIYALKFNREVKKEDDNDRNAMNSVKSLMEELPVVLYFHNDEPNPNSWDTTTTVSYAEAYTSYNKLIPQYIKEDTRGIQGEKREDAEAITKDFFELKVKKGMDDLNTFSDLLLKELEKGQSVKVYVRGFASPRAQSDYNLNLTKRRTSSLVNFMLKDSAGVFVPYMEDRAENGARLEFELLPFGEFKADASVSDDLTDEKNSIYNRSACLERKIEIERVDYIPNTVKQPVFIMDKSEHDFGIIPKYGAVEYDFTITNSGNAPMQIDSVIAECGCTDPKLDKSLILPGEEGTLHVGFNPISKQGVDEKHVFIYVHGEEPRVLTIRAERGK